MYSVRSISGIDVTSAPATLQVQDAGPHAQPASDHGRPTPRDTPTGAGGAMPDRSDERSDAMRTASLYRAAPPDLGHMPARVRRSAGDAIAPHASRANDAIAELLAPLTAATRPDGPPTWQPVPRLAESLDALYRYASHAADPDKVALRSAVADMLTGARHHRKKDVDLLSTVIDGAIAGHDPSQMLGSIAERSLNLPNFKIRPDDQPEPPERHFTSTLLPFAAAAYDYGPLGRTLLLEGARACFAGPSQAQRVEKLQEAMFALPNPRASGEPLESMADIWGALRDRGIDV